MSKYYPLYLKLDAAVDSHVFGAGTEIEIERAKKDILGSSASYIVTRQCITSDGNWSQRKTHLEEFKDFTDVDQAIEKAKELYEDRDSLPENWMLLEVKVKTSDGKMLWDNGFSY